MLWLTGLLIAILVLSSDMAARQPVEQVAFHTLIGLICLLLAPAFAVLQSFVTTRRWAGREMLEHRVVYLHRSLLFSNLVVWLVGCVALLVIARWPQMIRENWNLNRIPLLDELALVLPMIGSILLSWIVIYDAEKTLQSSVDADRFQRLTLTWQRFRTFFGLVLVPLAILFLARDIVDLWFPEGISNVSMAAGCTAFLIALLVFYPILVSCSWKTKPLDEPVLRERLIDAARDAGLHNERFAIWNTGGTIANAVVVGIMPRLRRVFFTDQLLEKFDDDEVVAIYRHELGHIAHHHLLMRLALVLVPLLGLMVMAFHAGTEQALESAADSLPAWLFLSALGLMAFIIYAAIVISRFVRKSEIEADLFAIRLASGRVCPRRADSYCRALLKMAANSPELFERSTMGHPSIKMRIEVIRQVLEQPEAIQKFSCRFLLEQRIVAVVLLGFFVSVFAVGLMA